MRFFSIHQMPPVPRRPPRGQGEPRQYYFLSLTHRQNRRQQSESFDIGYWTDLETFWFSRWYPKSNSSNLLPHRESISSQTWSYRIGINFASFCKNLDHFATPFISFLLSDLWKCQRRWISGAILIFGACVWGVRDWQSGHALSWNQHWELCA